MMGIMKQMGMKMKHNEKMAIRRLLFFLGKQTLNNLESWQVQPYGKIVSGTTMPARKQQLQVQGQTTHCKGSAQQEKVGRVLHGLKPLKMIQSNYKLYKNTQM